MAVCARHVVMWGGGVPFQHCGESSGCVKASNFRPVEWRQLLKDTLVMQSIIQQQSECTWPLQLIMHRKIARTNKEGWNNLSTEMTWCSRIMRNIQPHKCQMIVECRPRWHVVSRGWRSRLPDYVAVCRYLTASSASCGHTGVPPACI